MIPVRYVWLAWSSLFFLVWMVLFIWKRNHRLLMWWSSLLALPFGFSEPFFLMHYWHPPSVFNLTHTVHADLETFLFCFSIGGTAAVGYHVVGYHAVTRRPVPPVRHSPLAHSAPAASGAFAVWYVAGLLAPVPAFAAILVITREIIWAGIAGFAAGSTARLICRPDLASKTIIGGLIFLGYYTVLLLVLLWMAPGYIDVAWNLQGPAAVRWFGLPVTELLFGLCFGLYWSGLFEQIVWLFAAPGAPGDC